MIWRLVALMVAVLLSRSVVLAEGRVDPSGGSFTLQQKERMKILLKSLDDILKVKGQRSVDNTLRPLNKMSIELDNALSEASLFSQVHPKKEVRDHARKWSRFGSRWVTTSLREGGGG
jgi:hypothetical protein